MILWQEESVKMLVIPLMDPRTSQNVCSISIKYLNLQRVFIILINTQLKINLVLVPDVKMQYIL